MRSPLRRLLVLACAFSAAGLTAQVSTGSLRVLFLGNSLTDGNNVPALVQAMAQLQGVPLQFVASAPGGYAIEDHWLDGRQALLASGDFDVLVLQQGPSTLPESQAHLRQWSITWADEARRHGTQPALYMIWPVRTQAGGFGLVSQSYRNAAIAANASIFPAGEAWQQAILADPSIQLYSSDDLHATPAGSFLAAMVIARGLVGLDPARVPTSVNGITVSTATLARFRTVVAEMPAATLGGPPPVGTPPAVTPPTVTAPVTPTPSTGASRGGGGAPSNWFLLALLAAGGVRLLGLRRSPRSNFKPASR